MGEPTARRARARQDGGAACPRIVQAVHPHRSWSLGLTILKLRLLALLRTHFGYKSSRCHGFQARVTIPRPSPSRRSPRSLGPSTPSIATAPRGVGPRTALVRRRPPCSLLMMSQDDTRLIATAHRLRASRPRTARRRLQKSSEKNKKRLVVASSPRPACGNVVKRAHAFCWHRRDQAPRQPCRRRASPHIHQATCLMRSTPRSLLTMSQDDTPSHRNSTSASCISLPARTRAPPEIVRKRRSILRQSRRL